MEKNILINISKNMQDLTFVLANKNYNRLGALSNVDQNTVVYKKTMHGSELSFEVYKTLDDIEERLWDKLVDFKLIWVKEINEYFQITISLDDSSSIAKKTITGTSLCEAELGQTNLYGVEINTEDDIARDDYKVTTFYNMDDSEASLIHRVLSKVPNYTIKHVDASLSKIQRSFSIDGTSILDFLTGDCAEQFNCLFEFDSTDRSVSVYDLKCVCNDCENRDDMSEFTHTDGNGALTYTCPKCGSHDVKYYGDDTKIFVDNENLTEEVKLETDTDSVKNCFKLVAGDDLMTATVRLLNMNGSDYICYISDDQKKDMPSELVDKIESYDELCTSYNEEYESLVEQIYEASDKLYYYKHTMMPTIEQATITAETEAAKLTVQNLSPVALGSVSSTTSKSTVESALKNYAKVYVKSGYVKLEINDSSYSYNGEDSSGNHYGTWTGNFKVTNYSDEDDIAYSPTITVKVYDNYYEFVEQKVRKNILNSSSDKDNDSIFDVLDISDLDNFKDSLTYYCMERLKSFYDAIQTAIDVLVQMNQGSPEAEMYDALYVPYYNKLQACQAEIDKRQQTVDEWQDKYDSAVSRQQEIQKILNFENYIGEDLYKLFCCYRREDTYQNDNYISDGLEDQEVIDRAKEFLEVAKKELVKSATMQHSISTTLYNLMLIPEFKPILDSFEVGNWIRVRVDGDIYKLRLIEYTISFSDTNTIAVEFSDVTKIRDSVSDIQSILKDSQSMASSYSYISKQADAGHKASVNMDKIVEDGLNSTLIRVKNNDREEITYDRHGILCREYDDISDSYSDEQLLITHNILAFTDDNWQTSSLGLGKHEFIRYDGNKFVKDVGYGLSAKFSQNMYSYAGQIIGGDIYSKNYSSTAGTHLDLDKGSFSFAGGKFTYNPDKDEMIMRGVTIKWDTSTPPEITDIDGLDENLKDIDEQLIGVGEYLDQLDGRIQTFSQSTDPSIDWTTTDLKNKHTGDLWFNPDNGLTKRWTGTEWETITDSTLESLAKSKAQIFTAKPTVAYYKGDMLIPVDSFTVSGVTYKQERAYRALKDSSGTTFSNSDWDALDYTNDDAIIAFINGDYADDVAEIRQQIDGKSNCTYGGSTPQSNPEAGDLWFCTDSSNGYGANKAYMYNGSTWVESNGVPDSVWDIADGKSSIFVVKPNKALSTVDSNFYHKNDIWILESDMTLNGTSYKKGSIMTSTSDSTSFVENHWVEKVRYTDMASVEEKGYQNASQVTTITENTIMTTNLLAENLQVKSANIDGEITASQINTTGLIAEDISATTISGKTITGATITGSSGSFTEGFYVSTPLKYGGYYGIEGNVIIEVDERGMVIGIDPTYNDFFGFVITENGINIKTPPHNSNYDSFDCVMVDGNPLSKLEGSSLTSGIKADYVSSSTKLGNLIKFSNSENNLQMAATAQYVQGYAARYDHTHSVYASLDHSHGNYASYTSSVEGTNKISYAVRNMDISGNCLSYTVDPINFSDERLKDIFKMPDILNVYMDFEPIAFVYKNGLKGFGNDVHYGLSAQKVKENLLKHNFPNNSAIVWTESPTDLFNEKMYAPDSVYHLDKDELHAMHIQMIQKHQHDIEQLKQENLALQNRVSILEMKMEELLNAYNN